MRKIGKGRQGEEVLFSLLTAGDRRKSKSRKPVSKSRKGKRGEPIGERGEGGISRGESQNLRKIRAGVEGSLSGNGG